MFAFVVGVRKCRNLKIGKEILNEMLTFESKAQEGESCRQPVKGAPVRGNSKCKFPEAGVHKALGISQFAKALEGHKQEVEDAVREKK